ncbi:hypothetical protein [uncultured Methanobrevibacter sp.]|uniref:hypothetical protein n=1 Tax=uncultured Methanobrevibacter sp. TaxID=253161 RepID=UPI0025EF52C7|nr:hypothetical protein [uncultured Methanobrevibacter sp.]
MTERRYEYMSHEELIAENEKVIKQTEILIKITYIVLGFTFIAYFVLILLKLGVIK